MKTKNSVFTVTPPDFQLTQNGPTVLLLGVEFDDITPYVNIYDTLFPDIEIVYMISEAGIDEDNLAWHRAAAGMASSVFVDIDNITTEELFLAMQLEQENKAMVYWINQSDNNALLRCLLNSYQYQVFNNLQEVEKFLEVEYGKNG